MYDKQCMSNVAFSKLASTHCLQNTFISQQENQQTAVYFFDSPSLFMEVENIDQYLHN